MLNETPKKEKAGFWQKIFGKEKDNGKNQDQLRIEKSTKEEK
jgi:hypothetical protein